MVFGDGLLSSRVVFSKFRCEFEGISPACFAERVRVWEVAFCVSAHRLVGIWAFMNAAAMNIALQVSMWIDGRLCRAVSACGPSPVCGRALPHPAHLRGGACGPHFGPRPRRSAEHGTTHEACSWEALSRRPPLLTFGWLLFPVVSRSPK